MNGPQQPLSRRAFLQSVGVGAAGAGMAVKGAAQERSRPNIVWIVVEDMSCHFGYQGEKLVKTPNLDKLAATGVDFRRAYITCPVCSPSRSAMITGMYQTTIGAHNHRSSRGTVKHELPGQVRLIPDLFRDAGYYVCNSNGLNWRRPGKTDYNFVFDADLYDGSDWSDREPDQPFFAQVQLKGGKYGQTGGGRNAKVPEPVSPDDVTLPPYYPDHPVFREDWAQYLNAVMHTDEEVGHIMQRLEDEGIPDNTVVVFMTDHGISHVRGKQYLYEEGIHIPFIVWAPGRVPGGAVRDDFVAHIDMAATSLYFAGITIPEYMEARPLFGPDARPREFVVSGRDRCDETVDRIRSVRKGDFKYIRNFYPKRPYLQPCAYKDAKLILRTMRELYAAGELDEIQSLIMADSRPQEELYDLRTDPHEIRNLAGDPAHESTLKELRGVLEDWIRTSGDKGQRAESPAMYDSDMKVYVDGMKRRGRTEYAATVEKNIRLMKQWREQGM